MSVEDAPGRRRSDRRREDRGYWRALKGGRVAADRRRVPPPADPDPRPLPSEPDPDPDSTHVTGGHGEPDAPDVAAAAQAEQGRRAALRKLLDAAEAHRARTGRRRRPVLAKGRRVVVLRGELAGRAGLILDADYIESRVLLRIDDQEAPLWVPFSRVAEPDEVEDRP